MQAGRDPQLRDAAADCFAAYDQLAASILKALGVPEPERLAGPVVALVIGFRLRRVATNATTDILVDALLLLTGTACPAPPK
ncbi:hypothetical protein AB0D08_31505 [Kitasatospora sp. NPDC048540]|uniref:hypothetical protein n=1 Tax=unclassified Kitasatospora TaxID=2633591 RepID=UPI0033CD12DF